MNFIFHKDNQFTGVWKYCVKYEILRCLFKNRLFTEMLRIHLFSIFTIKTPRTLAAPAPLGLLIVNTLTNVTITITCTCFLAMTQRHVPLLSSKLTLTLNDMNMFKYIFIPQMTYFELYFDSICQKRTVHRTSFQCVMHWLHDSSNYALSSI